MVLISGTEKLLSLDLAITGQDHILATKANSNVGARHHSVGAADIPLLGAAVLMVGQASTVRIHIGDDDFDVNQRLILILSPSIELLLKTGRVPGDAS